MVDAKIGRRHHSVSAWKAQKEGAAVVSSEQRERTPQRRRYPRYRDPGATQLVEVFDRTVATERFVTETP